MSLVEHDEDGFPYLPVTVHRSISWGDNTATAEIIFKTRDGEELVRWVWGVTGSDSGLLKNPAVLTPSECVFPLDVPKLSKE